ncbi:hypothetical protein [Natronococcus occultus]|uniref:Uncharacterized protein n=1 Tax=Natronococcus occultus SP4 TaxID=694430 RepID=L0K1D5_9EURY|nr:hypothetical protein [Natronococcus occultus]AGB38786.1 hypothetical protein Natoc_3041 [Natronococcus occultus SP4]
MHTAPRESLYATRKSARTPTPHANSRRCTAGLPSVGWVSDGFRHETHVIRHAEAAERVVDD